MKILPVFLLLFLASCAKVQEAPKIDLVQETDVCQSLNGPFHLSLGHFDDEGKLPIKFTNCSAHDVYISPYDIGFYGHSKDFLFVQSGGEKCNYKGFIYDMDPLELDEYVKIQPSHEALSLFNFHEYYDCEWDFIKYKSAIPISFIGKGDLELLDVLDFDIVYPAKPPR